MINIFKIFRRKPKININFDEFNIVKISETENLTVENENLWAVLDNDVKVFKGTQEECKEFIIAFEKLIKHFFRITIPET